MIKKTVPRRRLLLGVALAALGIALIILGNIISKTQSSTAVNTSQPLPRVEPAETVTATVHATMKESKKVLPEASPKTVLRLNAKLWVRVGNKTIDPVDPNLAKVLLAALGPDAASTILDEAPPETVPSITSPGFHLEAVYTLYNHTSNTTFTETRIINGTITSATVTINNTVYNLQTVLDKIMNGNYTSLPETEPLNITAVMNITATYSLALQPPENTTIQNITLRRVYIGNTPIATLNITVGNETGFATTSLVVRGPAPAIQAISLNLYIALTTSTTPNIVDALANPLSMGATQQEQQELTSLVNGITTCPHAPQDAQLSPLPSQPQISRILYGPLLLVETHKQPIDIVFSPSVPTGTIFRYKGGFISTCSGVYCSVEDYDVDYDWWQRTYVSRMTLSCEAPRLTNQTYMPFNTITIADNMLKMSIPIVLYERTNITICFSTLVKVVNTKLHMSWYNNNDRNTYALDVTLKIGSASPLWGCTRLEPVCKSYPCAIRLTITVSVNG